MQLPVVHLNGTGRETLTREYTAALEAVRAAFAAVADVTVNGRDYYPAGPGAFDAALEQHQAQLRRLGEVQEHLETVLLHLTDLGGGR